MCEAGSWSGFSASIVRNPSTPNAMYTMPVYRTPYCISFILRLLIAIDREHHDRCHHPLDKDNGQHNSQRTASVIGCWTENQRDQLEDACEEAENQPHLILLP